MLFTFSADSTYDVTVYHISLRSLNGEYLQSLKKNDFRLFNLEPSWFRYEVTEMQSRDPIMQQVPKVIWQKAASPMSQRAKTASHRLSRFYRAHPFT